MKGFKHEVWQEPDAKTMLCLSGKYGDDARKLLEKGSKLLHSFYAVSHYEAMTIYYKYMDWGQYTISFEVDRQPYEEWLDKD